MDSSCASCTGMLRPKTRRGRSSRSDPADQTIRLLKTTTDDLRRRNEALEVEVENERSALKALKREMKAEMKNIRDQEAKKTDYVINELKRRFEMERDLAVKEKGDQLEKHFHLEFTRFVNCRDEEMRRMKMEEKKMREELANQLKELKNRQASVPSTPTSTLERRRPMRRDAMGCDERRRDAKDAIKDARDAKKDAKKRKIEDHGQLNTDCSKCSAFEDEIRSLQKKLQQLMTFERDNDQGGLIICLGNEEGNGGGGPRKRPVESFGRSDTLPRPKASRTSSTADLSTKSRQLTESLKQLKQAKAETSSGRRNSLTNIESLRAQLEERDKTIASLRAAQVPDDPLRQIRESTEMQRSYHVTTEVTEARMRELYDQLTEEGQANKALVEKMRKLEDRETKLKSELQDAKDQAELLEFRVLELEEEQEKIKTSNHKDACIETDGEAGSDSGCNSSTTTEEELLELYQDFRKEKVADTKTRLQALVTQTSEASNKSLLLQTVALFETLLAKIHDLQDENEALKSEKDLTTQGECDLILELEATKKKLDETNTKFHDLLHEKTTLSHDLETSQQSLVRSQTHAAQMTEMQAQIEGELRKQITDLQGKLQSAMVGRQAESEMYSESLQKTAQLERTVTSLNAKVRSLIEENSDLKDQHPLHRHSKVPSVLSDTSDDHPKTTGSSSGVSSDLSDSENEHHEMPKELIESGIYDSSNHIDHATQTGGPEPKLNEEIEKLSRFRRAMMEDDGDELYDLREECKELVTRKNDLEDEIENYKAEILALKRRMESSNLSDQKMLELERVELSLRNQLKEWEKKYEVLFSEHQNLLEEKCELEEAENDSRLNAQRFEQQYHAMAEKTDYLDDQLQMERQTNQMMRSELEQAHAKEEEARNEASYLEALVQRYEQRIFELEEVEVELREKLYFVEQAVRVVFSLNQWNKTTTPGLQALPMIIRMSEQGTQTEEAIRDEDEVILVQKLESEKLQLQDQLTRLATEKDSLAVSLEGSHEDKIQRIVELEDRVSDMLLQAKETGDAHQREVATIKQQMEHQAAVNAKKIAVLEAALKDAEVKVEAVGVMEVEMAGLKEKQAAYERTIAEADSILEKVEANHRATIQALVHEKAMLQEQVQLLQSNEDRIRQCLKVSSVRSETVNISEILEKLMSVEKSEMELKEKVYKLERSEKSLELKLLEQQKINVDVRTELQDQEDLIAKLRSIELENQKLMGELHQLREQERRLQDIQQSERFLRTRVDELEQKEAALKAEVATQSRMLEDRERKWSEKLGHMEDEIFIQKQSVEQDTAKEHKLRLEVEGLKGQVSELESTVETKQHELEQSEASTKSELSKLRHRLKVTDSQLTDMDAYNAKLKGEISELEKLLKTKSDALDTFRHQEQQNQSRWTHQLQTAESQISALQSKLEQLSATGDSREDLGSGVAEGGIVAVTKHIEEAVKMAEGCPSCRQVLPGHLIDAAQHLHTLSAAMMGRPNSDDDLLRCESEENVNRECMDSGLSISLTCPSEDTSSLEYESFESTVLTSQLEQLQSKIDRMEEEMTIVGEESKELQERLKHKEEELLRKTNELESTEALVEHFRLLNARATESFERQKSRTEGINNRLSDLQSQIQVLDRKCLTKDFLIRCLADLLRASSSMRTNAILQALRETTFKPSFKGVDFNLEGLCHYIESSKSSICVPLGETTNATSVPSRKPDPPPRTDRERSPLKDLDRSCINVDPTLRQPENFRILRRVGSDSLLLAWAPPEDKDVSGYLLYVNKHLHQKVRTASRTKALLHTLKLDQDFSIGIHSTGPEGTVSHTVYVNYTFDMILQEENKSQAAKPLQ